MVNFGPFKGLLLKEGDEIKLKDVPEGSAIVKFVIYELKVITPDGKSYKLLCDDEDMKEVFDGFKE